MAGKYLDEDGLRYLWSLIETSFGDPSYWPLDTTATSGRDYDLWRAIQSLGWDSEVITND